MFPILEQAARIKKEAFGKLDAGHKKYSIDLNTLIDIILAYESAARGDTQNLNYNIEVQKRIIKKYEDLMEEISEIADVDSEIWKIAMTYV